MGTLIGAVGGAVLLMLTGRAWKGRDLIGVAVAMMMFGVIVGAFILTPLMVIVAIGAAADAAEGREITEDVQAMTVGLMVFGAVYLPGLLFIAAAQPGERPQPRARVEPAAAPLGRTAVRSPSPQTNAAELIQRFDPDRPAMLGASGVSSDPPSDDQVDWLAERGVVVKPGATATAAGAMVSTLRAVEGRLGVRYGTTPKRRALGHVAESVLRDATARREAEAHAAECTATYVAQRSREFDDVVDAGIDRWIDSLRWRS